MAQGTKSLSHFCCTTPQKTSVNCESVNEREQSQVYLSFAGPTNETRAETKLVWAMPCKEEEDDSQRRADARSEL